MSAPEPSKRTPLSLRVIGPGLLVAATGIGASDIAVTAYSGSQYGLMLLWAVAIGAIVKFILNENLARWQLGTGRTILEGAVTHLGILAWIAFGVYLLPWTFLVGGALLNACGVTAHALAPFTSDPVIGNRVYGAAAGLIACTLVLLGGYKAFARVMGVCIVLMFLVVILGVAMRPPNLAEFASGLFLPRTPRGLDGALWTVALIGSVGGTLTVICYAYWMQEAGIAGREKVKEARLDLAIGYIVTGIFGFAMMTLAQGIELTDPDKASTLITGLADRLQSRFENDATRELIPPAAFRYIFLLGAFGAMFSSILGVWQSVPYVFADWWRLRARAGKPDLPPAERIQTGTPLYRGYLIWITLISLVGVFLPFKGILKWYAVVGALFFPGLALAVLLLNGRRRFGMPDGLRNPPIWSVILALILAAMVVVGVAEVLKEF